MDYTETLDKLIKDFAGETGSLLKKVSKVNKDVGGIQKNVATMTDNLASYESDARETSLRLSEAAKIFEGLTQTVISMREDIASQLSDARTKMQSDVKSIHDDMLRTERNVAATARTTEEFSDRLAKQKVALDNILEKCSRIQSEQLQLSARLDKIAKDAEASKIKAEEDRQQTQAQLTGILQKLDALDNKIPEKKRGLFR